MTLSIATIQAIVARHYGLPRSAMLSPRRWRRIARPRMIAMYLAREFTHATLPRIGQQFGGRDHTTILSAIRRVSRTPELFHDLAVLRERLRWEAEIAELGALSGRVYLAAEEQVMWSDPPPKVFKPQKPRPKRQRDYKKEWRRRCERMAMRADLSAYRTDVAIPSALADR